MSAPNIEDASEEPAERRFFHPFLHASADRIEAFLERERAQLPLWFAVAFGAGIAGWLWMPGPSQWTAFIALVLGVAGFGFITGSNRRGRALLLGGLAMAAGCALIWLRSEFVAAPRLERPAIVTFEARLAIGAAAAASVPLPTLLVTGDGQHLALVRSDGVPVLLRSRSGDFVRDLMSEASAYDGDPANLEDQRFARCSRDACVADVADGSSAWRLLAIRSRHQIEWTDLTRACADADIVVSDRRLPRGCNPRWLKLDRLALDQSGGLAIYLGGEPRVETVAERLGAHPWTN